MREIPFNANNYVMVKLKDAGREELQRRADEFLRRRPGWPNDVFRREEDAEGWSKWQLWDFMETFGHMVGLGREMPFDAAIRFLIDE